MIAPFVSLFGSGFALGALLVGFWLGHLAPEFFIGGVALMMVCNWISLQAIKAQHVRNMREADEVMAMMLAARHESEDMG